jgi:5,10-methylenetetrahydromethanopterin reductase
MARLFDRFGIATWSMTPPREMLALARRADTLGFHSFWLAEFYHYRSAPPLAAALGAATTRIHIGLGILPTHSRHPALTAMEAATLDELNGGRLLLGLGAARTAAARHLNEAKPLAALRDAITIARGLLQGSTVTHRGTVWSAEGAALQFRARADLPIYVGTYPAGRQTLRLAGALADGVVLVWCSPAAVRRACEIVAEGAHAAGRDPASIDIAAYLVVSVDDDAARARAACKPLVASYTPRPVGWREEGLASADDMAPVLDAFARGGLEAATQAVTDAYVEKIAIAGDLPYCRQRLQEYVGTGLRLPIAYQVLGPDPMHALDLLAQGFVDS